MTLVMGAVAYDPKVVSIWAGFRRYLVDRGLAFDFVLYSNYERQAIDSPQASLLPLSLLRKHDLVPGKNLQVRRFDVGVGLHGDHIGGERDAARALMAGTADAACMTDTNHLLFTREGTVPARSTRILGQTEPYDHCVMTVGPAADPDLTAAFGDLLLAMSYDDATVRPLLDMEGLKRWYPGRTSGYAPLEAAVDEAGFYGSEGDVRADGYRP